MDLISEAVALGARYSYSVTTPQRLVAMARAVRTIEKAGVPGDIVECGIWKGGHLMIARKLAPTRRCWGYDTFTGMTKPTDDDRNRAGYRARDKWDHKKKIGHAWCGGAPLETVRQSFAAEGLADDDLVRFVAGDVAKTLRDPANLPETIALLRLDTDWYESTKIELEVLYPRLQPGGILIVDDYGHWLGAQKAVDEYFDRLMPKVRRQDRHEQVDYTCILMTKGVA